MPATAWTTKILWLRSRIASTSPPSSYDAGTICTPVPFGPVKRYSWPSRRMFPRRPEANAGGDEVTGMRMEPRRARQRAHRRVAAARHLLKRKPRRIRTSERCRSRCNSRSTHQLNATVLGPFVRYARVSRLRSVADRCMLLL